MEKKKNTSKVDFNKIKEILIDVLKKVGAFVKKIVVLIKKLLNFLSKKKVGNFNGAQIFVGAIVLILLVLILNIGKVKQVAYPVIYNTSEGDLYLVDTEVDSHENAVKLGNGESTSHVVYANTTDRYVLFQKNESLYLYDAKEADETTEIISDVEDYFFSEDDKYIVALDDDGNLYVYDYNDKEKIEKDVTHIYAHSEDKVLYEKENILYVRSINPKKDDRLKVTEGYDAYVGFSEDGKNIIYLDNDRNLRIFNIKKDEDEKIASKVSSYYCDKKSCEKLFYVENDDTKTIYYYDGKTSKSLSKDIYSINAYDVDKKQIVFSKAVDGEYNLYYQKVGGDAQIIEKGITSLRTVKLFEGKDIYYINSDNELKYVRIRGEKVSSLKHIGDDVTGYLYLHKKGYVFVGDVKNNLGTLYLAKSGNVKQIDEKVNATLITVGNKGNSIYYLKDYQTTGDLYVSKGGKGKEIEKDVYNYEYVKDNLIYLIKDYSVSKSRGDLYRYTNKSVLIVEDVTRMASIPVYFELD